MKQYEILRDFKGSQDGRFSDEFKAGTVAELSDYLAGIVVPDGWARLAVIEIDNKAITSDGDKPRRAKTKEIKAQ